MKKRLIKVTSYIMMVVFLFTTAFVFNTSATESDDEITCLSDHFSKLKLYLNGYQAYRIPRNEIGTCGQVAMSMVLSYYDFYWNNNFVPTIYNADGTSHEMGWQNGIYNSEYSAVYETITAIPETSAWNNGNGWDDFRDFAEYHENDFLLYKKQKFYLYQH